MNPIPPWEAPKKARVWAFNYSNCFSSPEALKNSSGGLGRGVADGGRGGGRRRRGDGRGERGRLLCVNKGGCRCASVRDGGVS